MAVKCTSKLTAKICLVVGIFLFVSALILMLLFPTILRNKVKREIALLPDSYATNLWENIPFPIYEKIYFFNVTNADDFVKNGAKLNVTQVGPYVYSSKWQKRHVHWHGNGTVSYREIKTFQFDPEMSEGRSEEELIVSLNGPMLTVASMVQSYPLALRMLLSFLLAIEGEEVIIRRTVKELAYGGYDDVLIKYAPYLKPDIPFKDGKFSWLYGKNGTDDGLFTVYTGEDDETKTNMIDKFNGQGKLNWWKGDSCNCINGTSMETGPPITASQEKYTFFQSFFCRSLSFNYSGESSRLGVSLKKFVPTYELFANGTENPDNACFDLHPGLASGVLDLSGCQFGANFLLSFPHFLLADPSYLDGVHGLHPDDKEHSSYLGVEPVTGVSADIVIRLQLNVLLRRVEGLFQMDDLREGVYPILWLEFSGGLDEALADELKFMLTGAKTVAYSAFGAIMGVSFIVVVASSVALFLIHKREKCDDDDPLLGSKEREKEAAKASSPVDPSNEQCCPTMAASGAVLGVKNQSLEVSSEVDETYGNVKTVEHESRTKDDDVAILNIDSAVPPEV